MILFIDGLVVFYASMNSYLGLKRGFLEEISRILGLAFSIIISFNLKLNLKLKFLLETYVLNNNNNVVATKILFFIY